MLRFPPHRLRGLETCQGGSWPSEDVDPSRLRQPVPYGLQRGRMATYALCPRCLSAGRRTWVRVAVEDHSPVREDFPPETTTTNIEDRA